MYSATYCNHCNVQCNLLQPPTNLLTLSPAQSPIVNVNSTGNHTNEAILLSSLVLNCQSLVSKKESFMNLLDLHHPDIVFGSESWLKPNILSTEVFPPGYMVYRKDHSDGYGGIFIACRNVLSSFEVPVISDVELVACQIQLADHSSLIVCSIYCPPSSDNVYLDELCNQLNQSALTIRIQLCG